MKKFIFLIFAFSVHYLALAQLNNDIKLVKPIINFNDADGGFYRDMFLEGFDTIFCGAVVENTGLNTATNVYLRIHLADGNQTFGIDYYSDTLAILGSGQRDTVRIPYIPNPGLYIFSLNFYYEVFSDSVDQNISDNRDTLSSRLWASSWAVMSRSDKVTDTFRSNTISGFSSGDFIGITLKTVDYYNSSFHIFAGLAVYLTDTIDDSLSLTAEVYCNGKLILQAPVNKVSGGLPFYWQDAFFSPLSPPYNFFDFYSDSNYIAGVRLDYPDSTTPLNIGIDRSVHHNFDSEGVAIVNGTLIHLDFVPLIKVVCDPEGIEEAGKKARIHIYPNPVKDILTGNIRQTARIELIKPNGTVLYESAPVKGHFNIRMDKYPPGLYILRINTSEDVFVKKIIKL